MAPGNPVARPLMVFAGVVLALGVLCISAASEPGPSEAADLAFSKPYVWLFGGWVAPPRIPAVGDINGDGYTDFLYASPEEKLVDLSLNGKGWKPMRGERLLSNLPEPVASLCVARLNEKGYGVAVLGRGGQLLRAPNAGNGTLQAAEPLAVVKGWGTRAWLLAGRLSSAVLDDLIVVGDNGMVQVYGADGHALHAFHLRRQVTSAAVGDVDGDGRCELAILSGSGVVIVRPTAVPEKIAAIPAPRGQPALAAGDVSGDGLADVLVNGRVFLAPEFRKAVSVPGWRRTGRPVVAFMADVVGHRRCDVIVQRQGSDYYASKEADCEVYVSYSVSDRDWDCDGLSNDEEKNCGADPLDRDTDLDGLLDGWEVHGFAGVDLRSMGASPRHKDVLVMNLPYDTVPIDQMEKAMRESVVPFFARIPYTNLDGTPGFAVHWQTQLPPVDTKASAGKGWPQLAAERFPRELIGLYHWMLIGGLGGGGQSGQLADTGSTGMGSWAHEFGHQLGLSHTGKWAAWSPTYTSLMNYSYSYQFEGDGKKIHFSTGELAKLVLNESRLPGRVPYPMEKLKFLGGPPFRFRMKPAGSNATYVDWAWSGRFTAGRVRANITYGYSVNGGDRLQPDGKRLSGEGGGERLMTDYQASLVVHAGDLYMLTACRGPVDPRAPRPVAARLVLQRYQGKHVWSPPAEVAPAVTGDPIAVSDGREMIVLYPTPDGVVLRRGQPGAFSAPLAIPDTKAASVSAAVYHGTVLIFLYRDPNTAITYRTFRAGTLGPERTMGIRSTIPPGAAVDTARDQLLLGTATEYDRQPYRWQLWRLVGDGETGFQPVSCRFVGGPRSGWAGNRRPTLIFRAERDCGPEGRIYWIAAGVSNPPGTPTGLYVARTIGYPDYNEGWMLWRYYDEWTNTRSGIAAAWFRGDIVLATTWASDQAVSDGTVYLGYNGTAIGNTDMADFDDVSLMADYGMARSIGTFAVMPAKGPCETP